MTNIPSRAEIDAYITARAPQYGVNPVTAIRVSHGELPVPSNWVGDLGTSFGPFQLHKNGGLGDDFIRQTGLSLTDPSTWKQQVDFSLQAASKGGWGPFHAAQKLGISTWEGIAGAASNVATTLKYYFPVVGYSGNPKTTYHTPGGTDLFAAEGTPVRAVVQGVVASVSSSGLGGNSLTVRGADGLYYYYAHLKDRIQLSAGDFIAGGQTFGAVGKTGNAANTGAHLHIGVGEDIQAGDGPSGGTGTHFDAQSFLSNLLHLAGSGTDPATDAASGASLGLQIATDPIGTATGAGADTAKSFLSDVHQGILNYVQNRTASIILLGLAILLVIVGAFGMVMKTDTGKALVAQGVKAVAVAAA